MNPALYALIGSCIGVIGWIISTFIGANKTSVNVGFNAGEFKGELNARMKAMEQLIAGMATQRDIETLRCDIEELREGISTNNTIHYGLQKDFDILRLKIAKELGINGG